MKFSSLIVLCAAAAGLANASYIDHSAGGLARRHSNLAHNFRRDAEPSQSQPRRCKARATDAPTPSPKASTKAEDNKAADNKSDEKKTDSNKSDSKKTASTPNQNNAVAKPDTNKSNDTTSKAASSGSSNAAGLIAIVSKQCGASDAIADTTSDNGPNGSEDWINCGIHEPGGWNPPPVKLDDLHIVDFEDALKDSKSPFHACSGEIKDAIRSVAQDKKVPATLIASVIMQESSCKPETTGAGGEQGLMQITKDKCDPGVNCKEIHYNIARGTDFLLQLLAQFDYHILAVLGNYNGWHLGLTFEDAIKAQHSDCCLCMNNLDYPFQYVNGWLRNKDPYVLRLGKYHNLEWC